MPLDALIALALLACGIYLLWAIPTPGGGAAERRAGDARHAEVAGTSVIIPARNEEVNIGHLLADIAAQSRPPAQVIVVDDHSADNTARIARRREATVIASADLPPGWTGKCWACWQGAQAATGDRLLFLDADVRLAPTALADLLAEGERSPGLVSVQPYHVTERAYEQLSAHFNLVLMASMDAFTPRGHDVDPGGAFGPCLLVRKSDYFAIGGHAHPRVRGQVLESIPLAQIAAEGGLPVRCFGGRGAVSFRMYPQGLRQLVEGWSKGFGSGALAISTASLLLCSAWITGCFQATIALGRALVTGAPTLSTLVYAGVYAVCAIQMGWMLRRIGRFQWWTWAIFPIPLFAFALIMLRSVVMIHLLGRVTWRGRSLSTTSGRTG